MLRDGQAAGRSHLLTFRLGCSRLSAPPAITTSSLRWLPPPGGAGRGWVAVNGYREPMGAGSGGGGPMYFAGGAISFPEAAPSPPPEPGFLRKDWEANLGLKGPPGSPSAPV